MIILYYTELFLRELYFFEKKTKTDLCKQNKNKHKYGQI